MKAAYFTPENISIQAPVFLAGIARKNSAPPFEWKQAALLVLDMQRYFLEPGAHAYIPSAPAILPNLQNLIAAFEQYHRPVFFTRHLNTSENAEAMAHWWHDLIRAENPLSALTPELTTGEHPVLIKSQYDAFHQTDLETLLGQQNIQQVVVSGVMTHLCCESTARTAFVRGFQVFFLVDGTATYNQDFHHATLLNLAHGFATPMLTQELLEAFTKDES
jgi:bifunctional isochorismate lyase/aryl carrier protein